MEGDSCILVILSGKLLTSSGFPLWYLKGLRQIQTALPHLITVFIPSLAIIISTILFT